jgi:hypothetical protein
LLLRRLGTVPLEQMQALFGSVEFSILRGRIAPLREWQPCERNHCHGGIRWHVKQDPIYPARPRLLTIALAAQKPAVGGPFVAGEIVDRRLQVRLLGVCFEFLRRFEMASESGIEPDRSMKHDRAEVAID